MRAGRSRHVDATGARCSLPTRPPPDPTRVPYGQRVSDTPIGIDFSAGGPEIDLEVRWIHGQPPGTGRSDPPIQVHWVDSHTAILRQSKQLTVEAPFLYLLFGNHSALLLDTGAVGDASVMPLASAVGRLVDDWLSDRIADGVASPGFERSAYRLVVAHTHGHSDHVGGDAQFAPLPHTTLVGSDVADVVDFFGFCDWPKDVVSFDLGGRALHVMAVPGHQEASIALYDPWTGFLLTGDTVYPGRLYVKDVAAFVDSLDRLVTLAERQPVSAVMGCHIEMTSTARVDYPMGTRFQPMEPPLQMTVDQLRQVREAARAVESRPGVHVFDDFVVFNGRCVTGIVRQLGRAWLNRGRERLRGTVVGRSSTGGA